MRGVNFVCQAVSARLARMVGTQLRPCRRFGCRACERMRVSECACVCVCVCVCVCTPVCLCDGCRICKEGTDRNGMKEWDGMCMCVFVYNTPVMFWTCFLISRHFFPRHLLLLCISNRRPRNCTPCSFQLHTHTDTHTIFSTLKRMDRTHVHDIPATVLYYLTGSI